MLHVCNLTSASRETPFSTADGIGHDWRTELDNEAGLDSWSQHTATEVHLL